MRGGDFLLLAMVTAGDSGRDAGRLCVRTALHCTPAHWPAHGTAHMGGGGDNGFSLGSGENLSVKFGLDFGFYSSV